MKNQRDTTQTGDNRAHETRVTIWNEFLHEKDAHVAAIYPDGIHAAIGAGIAELGEFELRYATLEDPEHGLTEEVLAATDTLLWWGHMAHDRVSDDVVARVHEQVLSGMGLVVLHSGHFSKIFQRVLGTHGSLRWREADEKERLWNLAPAHPVMQGVPDYFELPQEEMYGERFDIPTPDELLMISWFQGGEVFRSACTWTRGHGRVVYFRPGHETYPTYKNEHVLRVIANAAKWTAARVRIDSSKCPNPQALEPVPNPGKEHV